MKERKKNTKDLLKSLIPFRFYPFLIVIVLFGIIVSQFFNNELINQSYFWVLSSLVQGFSAFFGVIVALLTIGLASGSTSRGVLIDRIKSYVLPISLSAITLIYSIFGMVVYPILKSNYLLLAQFILIASSFAIWSILEIFFVIIKSISKQK